MGTPPWGLGLGVKSGVPVFRRWSPRGSAGLLGLELCVSHLGP